MEENRGTFLLAKNLADIFYHIKTVSDLRIVGSCTQFTDPHCKAVSTYGIAEERTFRPFYMMPLNRLRPVQSETSRPWQGIYAGRDRKERSSHHFSPLTRGLR